VNRDAALPPEFERYAAVPASPLELSPAEIGANREQWVDTWTRIVLR
jgi:thiamine transport system substrate-binding protein